jgi:hypothetical protein
VDPDAVEAQRPDELHLPAQRVGVGGGQVRVRPVALLEDEAQEVGTTVEEELAVGEPDAAEAEIAADLVDRPAVVQHRHVGVDEDRRLR